MKNVAAFLCGGRLALQESEQLKKKSLHVESGGSVRHLPDAA